jgi:hypothetical protein
MRVKKGTVRTSEIAFTFASCLDPAGSAVHAAMDLPR